MSGSLTIAPMSADDLALAIDWAAAEGWNPGLDDAPAFRSVDPGGFLMGKLGDAPVAAISVVRHSASFGFLGFYLCTPEHRGQGHGLSVWQAGMAHLGNRTVGLDGVPAQQDNYKRSGFALAHQTRRHAGPIKGQPSAMFRPACPGDQPSLLALDRTISGADRTAYVSAWMTQTPTRLTLVAQDGAGPVAVGTIRTCREGHKIGPLFAPDADMASDLIHALVAKAGADHVMIDVPDPNAAAVELAGTLGLSPVFACARMYRGTAPDRDLNRIFGETTFELG